MNLESWEGFCVVFVFNMELIKACSNADERKPLERGWKMQSKEAEKQNS